jgi:glycosyltransferase involved in cell wall biosynthesis
MRVVVTLPWGERLGGAEAMLQAILDGAQESGHELELVFFEHGPWPQELIDAGFRVEVIPAGHLREAHRWVMTVARLTAILRARKPDLLLNWAAKTQLYGAPAAVLAGMSERVVWWQQGIPDGHWIDRCATLLPARAIGCYSPAAARAQERLRPRRKTFVVAAGAPAPAASAPAASAPDAGAPAPDVGAPAPDVGALTPDLRGHSSLNGHSPIELASAPDVPVVGIVGRLQPWKGQDRLLAAQALLRERGHEMHLVIVGGDAYGLSTEYAESLPALVRRLGLDGAVTLTGQVPDAGPYIEQLDVLVNASDPEPFGIVLLEAMARGVPVVAVDSGGPAEFIDDGTTGVLARSGEPAALADALEVLLAAPESRREIGRAGRERFLAEFTDVALRRRFFHHLQAMVGNVDGDGDAAASARV